MPAAEDIDSVPVALVNLRPGDLVEVTKLKTAELNGVQGLLWRLDSASGRWEVKLPSGEVKAIRAENLAFRAVGPIEDDGTLALVAMLTDHSGVQAVLRLLGEELKQANEALPLVGHVISPTGGASARGEDACIWLKLARQAEQRVRGTLEELQKQIEAIDSINSVGLTLKAAGEFKMARKDLVHFVQAAQAKLEGALERQRLVLKRLASEVPDTGTRRKHGWSAEDKDEAPLQEKYREAFEERAAVQGTEQPRQPEQPGQPRLSPIVVKYQGRGDSPPASDNLYVKGLPGWVTEKDLDAIFSEAGEVQSMKLKAADWGAIAFVRLASKREATKAIQLFNGRVPERLAHQAEEQEAKRLEGLAAQAALRVVLEQLASGVLVVVDLARPLGAAFNDQLLAVSVEEDSQLAEAGVCRGWRARSIGGRSLANTSELVEAVQHLKRRATTSGSSQAALVFTPCPLVVAFDRRPLDLGLARDAESGLIFVSEAGSSARAKGIKPGAVLTMVAGEELSGLASEQEALARLEQAALPVELVFEQAQARKDSGRASAKPALVEVQSSDDSDEEIAIVAPAMGSPCEGLEANVDLSQPLGVFFDDALLVKEVQEGCQAARLGVRQGMRARSVGGEQVRETQELVARVQALRAQGVGHVMVAFLSPATAEVPDACGGVAPSDDIAEGEQTEANETAPCLEDIPGGLEVNVDLSQPLGVFFDDVLLVKEVQEGCQAARLGVRQGMRARSVGGEQVRETQELVARVQALRAQDIPSVTFIFDPSALGACDDTNKSAVDSLLDASASAALQQGIEEEALEPPGKRHRAAVGCQK